MSYVEAILLGIVQGVTEFLPISSDGHLKLAEVILGHPSGNKTFDVALHAGTLATILVSFPKEIREALTNRRLMLAVIVATLPLVPFALLGGKDLIDNTLDNVPATGVGFLITAAMLFATKWIDRGDRPLEKVRLIDALVIGVFQCLAPAPGVSRSGSTITGGLLMGLHREAAAQFSFLIAIPAICGAVAIYLKGYLKAVSRGEPTSIDIGPTIVGALVAFVVGLVAVKLVMAVVRRRQFGGFAWYCLLLGITMLVVGLSNPGQPASTEKAETQSQQPAE
jgi:undecaprenyl-diphosphatase